jgi:hypothetical protein
MRLRQWLAAGAVVVAGVAGTSASAQAAPGGGAGRSATRLGFGSAQVAQLRRLYAAYRHLPGSDVGAAVPGSAREARMPDGTQWAALGFTPSAHASKRVVLGFQDGAGTAIYTRQPGQAWRVAGLGMEPLGCATPLPARVRTLWRLASCSAGSPRPGGGPRPDSDTQQLADLAMDQIGIADTPADPSPSSEDQDCNPFTALENPGAGGVGCGTDPTFQIQDQAEFWCADMAKWVWTQAGVSSDTSTLDPAAKSFTTWGFEHGESLSLNQDDPAVGDAVVFYPPGTTQAQIENSNPDDYPADHVGIVSSVNANGTVNLVNGDFWGGGNYSVQYSTDVSIQSWASGIWASGEEWVYVSPQLSTDDRVPAAAVDSLGNQYVFWTNSGGGLEEEFYTAATSTWSGPNAITVGGQGMQPMGSEPTVAVGPQTVNGHAYQYVFWEGADRDLYEAYWNGSWHGPVALGDGSLGSPPAAGADSSGTVYVFWENLSRGLEEISGNGTTFGSPHAIIVNGNPMSPMGSSPTVAVAPDGSQQVYWESPGANLYEASWTAGDGWSGPTATGSGDLGGPPSAGADSSGNQYAFWESPGTGLYEASWNGSAWGTPEQVNGIAGLGSAPAAAVASNGSQYVFWEGPGGDHYLYEASSVNGGAWTGPVQVAGGVSMTG